MEDRRYAGLSPDKTDAADAETLAAEMQCRYRDRLRLFAARRLANVAEADDVVQEAIRRALEALKAGRIFDREALPGFLFQTARFICMQRARSARREGKALRRFAASGAQASEDPLRSLINDERKLAVRRALEQLEPSDRQVLELTYGDELDAEEIGRRLGASAGAIRVRRHRAIRRLCVILGVTMSDDRGHKD